MSEIYLFNLIRPIYYLFISSCLTSVSHEGYVDNKKKKKKPACKNQKNKTQTITSLRRTHPNSKAKTINTNKSSSLSGGFYQFGG
jgi:hypothetical protein